jgi:hypothetical protein
MLHFNKGTRFGRALIVAALLLLVAIVFYATIPLYNQPDFLGGSNVDVVTMMTSTQPGNIPNNVTMPVCKANDASCTVAATSGVVVAGDPGNISARGRSIRIEKPGLAGGITWASIITVFFAIWVICAIIAFYILIQETQDLVVNHFRSRGEVPPMS